MFIMEPQWAWNSVPGDVRELLLGWKSHLEWWLDTMRTNRQSNQTFSVKMKKVLGAKVDGWTAVIWRSHGEATEWIWLWRETRRISQVIRCFQLITHIYISRTWTSATKQGRVKIKSHARLEPTYSELLGAACVHGRRNVWHRGASRGKRRAKVKKQYDNPHGIPRVLWVSHCFNSKLLHQAKIVRRMLKNGRKLAWTGKSWNQTGGIRNMEG